MYRPAPDLSGLMKMLIHNANQKATTNESLQVNHYKQISKKELPGRELLFYNA